MVPIAAATVSKPYDETNDYANYEADGELYNANPGVFFLCFFSGRCTPGPNILIPGFEVVKKVVIKVRMAD